LNLKGKNVGQAAITGQTYQEVQPNVGHHQGSLSSGFQCGMCCLVFPDRQLLVNHLVTEHKKNASHFCYTCGKGFKTVKGFKNHQTLFHNLDKSIPSCECCGKRFMNQSSLKVHYRSHSDERDFVCTICGKAFKYKASLKDHVCT